MTEEEYYRVADDVVHRLRLHGNLWRLRGPAAEIRTLDVAKLAYANEREARLSINLLNIRD